MEYKIIRTTYTAGKNIYIKTFRVKKNEFDNLINPYEYFLNLLQSRKEEKCKLCLFMVCDEEDEIESVIQYE